MLALLSARSFFGEQLRSPGLHLDKAGTCETDHVVVKVTRWKSMSITSCEPRLGDGEPNKGGEDPSNPDSRDYVKSRQLTQKRLLTSCAARLKCQCERI